MFSNRRGKTWFTINIVFCIYFDINCFTTHYTFWMKSTTACCCNIITSISFKSVITQKTH